MHSDDTPHSKSRRDFLARSASAALVAGMPLLPKAAIAQYAPSEVAPEGAAIARVRIYPAIGISRVGGSDKWYYAPEVPGLPPEAGDGYKDGRRAIKKQVQRFRVYAFDAEDRVIGEVTERQGKIEWSAHLANAKAAWYGFNNPLDNGELAPGLPGKLRNQYFTDDDTREEMLVIDGTRISISGRGVNFEQDRDEYRFQGKFWGTEDVALGRLWTDEAGRLLVVPPNGVSNSPTNAAITSFADNDGWHDDWCDGPVNAQVTLPDGQVLEAEPSWVACVGPNFAPEIPPISTLQDLIADLNVQEGWVPPPRGPVSYRRDIYPTFRRVALMEWITNAARLRVGWMGVDFADPATMERLRDPSADNADFRREIFALFRDPFNDGPNAFKEERMKIPYMMGDGVNFDGSPLQWFRFPILQYEMLRAWAAGDFINDFDDAALDAITSLEDIPLAAQPAALSEAALEPCSGGAFHPGVELTYYLRLKEMYARNTDPRAEPFRIAHGTRNRIAQNVGRLLTPEKAFEGGNGAPAPLGPQGPGDLTRWMGLPWQCDAFSCQYVLMQDNFPTATWWPALLPIDVLPEEYYRVVMDTTMSPEDRKMFFDNRLAWSRGVAGIGYHANASYWDGITNMITLWERMGFVVKRPGPVDEGKPEGIPTELFVEVGRSDEEMRFDWLPDDGVVPN